MVRLRLRVASTGTTLKVDLPGGCTWAGLQAESRRAVGLPPDADIVLSLNKKVALIGKPNEPLSSLGVCGGDLVWLLAPEVPSAAPPTAAANDQPSARPAIQLQLLRASQPPPPPPAPKSAPAQTAAAATAAAAQPLTPPVAALSAPGLASQTIAATAGSRGLGPDGSMSAVAPRAVGVEARQQQQQQQQLHPAAAGGAGSSGSGSGSSHGGGGGVNAAMDVETQEVGGAEAAPEGDVDGTYEEGDDGAALAISGLRGVSLRLLRLLVPPTQAAAAAAPAVAAAAGASTSGGSGGGGTSCVWSLLPAATRCLLVLDCALAEAGFEGLQDLPALVGQGAAAPWQLSYRCRYISASSSGSGGGDQVMAGAAAADSAATGSGRGGGDGRSAVIEMPVAAKLLWYGMGRYVVVHGVPCTAGGGGGSPVTLNVDLAEYGGGAAGGTVTSPQTPQQEQQQALLLPADPTGHWRRLMDELVLPLLVGACRGAGVSPPLGLTVLPLELQMVVLRRLEGRDLAALSCVCTALHHLAGEDELWRPLYDKEFGPGLPATADAALANSRGYKHLYGRKWRERAERRKRRQVFRPAAPRPMWGPPALGPLVRPPVMPLGSIGGDYDRLPAPLLGGGPPAILGGRGGFGFDGGGTLGRGGLAGGLPGLGRRPGPWGNGGGGLF